MAAKIIIRIEIRKKSNRFLRIKTLIPKCNLSNNQYGDLFTQPHHSLGFP